MVHKKKLPRHFSSMIVVIEPRKYPDDPKKIAKELSKKYNTRVIEWSGG
jgi:FtsZ-interacting cell division protein YlmF